MAPPPSTRARRLRRVGLGVAAALLLGGLAWLGQQSLTRRAAPPAPAVDAPAGTAPVPVAPDVGWTLVQSQLCLRCHGMEQTHVGPGFAQIAQRYRNDPAAPAQLAARIQHGSAGRWGRRLMPRQPGIDAAQAQALAAWVLAQPDPGKP